MSGRSHLNMCNVPNTGGCFVSWCTCWCHQPGATAPKATPVTVERVELRACLLCNGTGERRWIGQHMLGDPSRTDRRGGCEPCPRCNATGVEPPKVRP